MRLGSQAMTREVSGGSTVMSSSILRRSLTLLVACPSSYDGIRRKAAAKSATQGGSTNVTMKCFLAALVAVSLCAQTAEQLEAHGATIANATYQGKVGVRVEALPNAANGESFAIIKGSRFH